jgi:hypothetical protein
MYKKYLLIYKKITKLVLDVFKLWNLMFFKVTF